MANDLVKSLRRYSREPDLIAFRREDLPNPLDEAADEIERLRHALGRIAGKQSLRDGPALCNEYRIIAREALRTAEGKSDGTR